MKRVKLIIAYDGTEYCGWQVQPNGLSVQEVLNRALCELTGETIRTIGASRTDAGVHARGNVAVFDTNTRMDANKYSFALNTYLPEDIRIQDSREVPSDFHPRFTETVKTYEYKILNRTFPDPTRRRDSLFCYGNLDREAMRRAAAYLEGEHDFRSFQGSGGIDPERSTVRTLCSVRMHEEEDMIRLVFTGNGFLYHMVRIMAGTLLDIGKGNRQASEMPGILAAKDRGAAGPTAPAHGLTLMGIRYPLWEKDSRQAD